MAILRILNGALKGKVFPVGDKEIFIGSSEDNDIIVEDAELEERHAAVFTVGEMCFIRDLKSGQGTFVNHVRIVEELLYTGDKIKVGSINIAFEESVPNAEGPSQDLEYVEEDDEPSNAVMELDISRKEKREDREDVDLALRNLEVIYGFTQDLAQVKERDHLLQLVVKKIAKTLQADNVYIFLKDKQGDLAPRAIWEKEKTKIAPVSRGIIRKALKSNKTVMTKDAASDARFRENLSIVKRKVKAVICAPLIARQQVLGVVYVGASSATQLFVTEDMELLTTIANCIATAIDNLRAHRKQSRLLMNMMRSLVTAMELAIPQNSGHSMRVASYAGAIAREKSLSSQKIYLCQLGGYLHDVGKIVTNTPGETQEQQEAYRHHVIAGEKILREMEGLEELIPAVKYHHEHYDGSGFPEGLEGEAIPLIARIVGLANYLDHFLNSSDEDADISEAMQEVKKLSGTHFHPDDIMALREAQRNGHLKIADVWSTPKTEDTKGNVDGKRSCFT